MGISEKYPVAAGPSVFESMALLRVAYNCRKAEIQACGYIPGKKRANTLGEKYA